MPIDDGKILSFDENYDYIKEFESLDPVKKAQYLNPIYKSRFFDNEKLITSPIILGTALIP